MEIEYQYTREDFIQFNKSYCAYGLRKRILFILVFSTLIPLFSVNGKSLNIVRSIVLGIIILGVLLIVYYIVPFVLGRIRINKIFENEAGISEHKKLTVINEGLLIDSESTTTTRLWESMKSAIAVNGFIYIQLADKSVIVFPDRFFTSHAEKVNFLGLIQNKIGPAKPASWKPSHLNQRKNPSISWVIACLIPIVGAIMSIVILADGASRYKEKWYILLGIGGILFTVFTAFLLLKPINGFLKEQTAPFAQMNVNTLMKDVEFYKMKHGAYPDSLKQLDDPSAPIYDAIISSQLNGNKTVQYNYKRVGNHYYLFSSGPDGIPGTTDDIYPQISVSDSSKFGLLHK
ncbi:MAG TPA: type II secretion system protein GspG [Mucilaginibacter sp.]|jgi:hypothetical protein|nr:type II secretion system protein GspG [Mucilaginibacter sp.]